MAEKMPDVDLRTLPRPGVHAYPWHEWADGSCWRLTMGEDFTVAVEKFRRVVHSHAAHHGMRGITRVDGPKNILVQFVKLDEDV